MCALFLSVISWPAAGSESASDCDSALQAVGGSRCPAGSAAGWTVAIIYFAVFIIALSDSVIEQLARRAAVTFAARSFRSAASSCRTP